MTLSIRGCTAVLTTCVVASALLAGAQSTEKPALQSASQAPPSAGSAKAASAEPFGAGVIDKSADPCVDFYQFACGDWMKNNPIPGDRFDWDSFAEVSAHNLEVLRGILERAAANDPKRTPALGKLGDFYASCMDEAAIDKLGWEPLKPELDRITSLKDKGQMMELIAHEMTIGPSAILSFYPELDPSDPRMVIGWVDDAGITLPDRAYYLQDRADMLSIRGVFTDHMTRMFALIGETPEQAARSAATVLKIETQLATATLDRAARRDPKNIDHRMTVAQLEDLAPNFQWKRFFVAARAPKVTVVNVVSPDYLTHINGLIEATPLEDWKIYLRWRMLHRNAPWLSKDFVEEDFHLRHAVMGERAQLPRWKRCVRATDDLLGDALGQQFVNETLGSTGKQQALQMVEALEKAMGSDITSLPWMSAAAKQQALAKLAATRNKIAYPDTWRDYTNLKVVRGDMLGNFFRANVFESEYAWQKLGKPLDKAEWKVTAPTLNGYRDNERNEIVFPAGILQPPFFDRHVDDAVNFGAIGFIVAHELTHGFDDQGRRHDAAGNLRDWWTASDEQEYKKRAACMVEEYSGFMATPSLHLNGEITLAENIADNGAARIAMMALHDSMTGKHEPRDKRVDGFTPDQRFFLGMARVWCQNRTLEYSRMAARTNEHAPGQWRINGVVQNMPEFQQAWGCKQGQPMVRKNACRVW